MLTAEMIPSEDIGTFISLAMEEKSGGNSPIIILSKAAKAVKIKIV
jgi:hypothetical protein